MEEGILIRINSHQRSQIGAPTDWQPYYQRPGNIWRFSHSIVPPSVLLLMHLGNRGQSTVKRRWCPLKEQIYQLPNVKLKVPLLTCSKRQLQVKSKLRSFTFIIEPESTDEPLVLATGFNWQTQTKDHRWYECHCDCKLDKFQELLVFITMPMQLNAKTKATHSEHKGNGSHCMPSMASE